jgi:MFS family permease
MSTTETLPRDDSPHRSPLPLLGRLSLMMFIQYFIQGAYLPIATIYAKKALGFSQAELGYFMAALAVGPMLAPFVVGQLVDRFFATERFLACCHLLGGLLMLALYKAASFWPVIVLGTAYSILYVPTMMLTNSLAFAHLKDRGTEFPWIRIFGTAGYIAPAYLIEVWWLRGLEGNALEQARGIAFAFSGLASAVMAAYCLTLPHTPPRPHQQRKYAPGAVLAMLGQRDFLVLVVVSFFVAIAHQCAITWSGPLVRDVLDAAGWGAYEQRISSAGQICELAVLAVLGVLIARLGYKRVFMIGAGAYLVRCLLFAAVFSVHLPVMGQLALATAANAMHGLCFGCFFAAAYIYLDRIAPPDLRGSMQTFYGVFVLALGFFVGGPVSGWIGEAFAKPEGSMPGSDWTSIWLTCAALCAACVLAVALAFPRTTAERREAQEQA